jgi:hypothetical protein
LKRLALLLALACAACATDGGRQADGGPRLRPSADPSAVIAAEIGFSQLAQTKGQWAAFRETAAAGAEMFVPERVKAADWLKGRADPSVPVKWQPHAVWSSCDGSYAATQGAWERPGSAGTFITIWERQKDSKYKWLLDMSISTESVTAAPEMVAGNVADCGRSVEQKSALIVAKAAREAATAAYRAMAGESGQPEAVFGAASDETLSWETRTADGGNRRFALQLWNGKAFDTVIDTAAPTQPR